MLEQKLNSSLNEIPLSPFHAFLFCSWVILYLVMEVGLFLCNTTPHHPVRISPVTLVSSGPHPPATLSPSP